MSKTIYEAIKEYYPETEYVEGCDIGDNIYYDKEKAVAAAKKADIVILTLGGKMAGDQIVQMERGWIIRQLVYLADRRN